MRKTLTRLLMPLFACSLPLGGLAWAAEKEARFERFDYQGEDPQFATALAEGHYRNPILAGFYPDPSICRVGDEFFLVNSSFAYFPGVPIFRSRDLVNWTQIGNVLSRESQLKLAGHGVSRGIFAPSLRHHDGRFYMITTLVDTGGNFYVTAKDPAGPWSDPVWLPSVDGIDPSFFFDDDGKAYVINNGGPKDGKALYEGHRGIWIQEFDVKAGRMVGPRQLLVNGGVDITKKPVWIEGPHIYKTRGWYYLSCAEGGTSVNHSQVVFRSKSVWGPWEPWSGNPILTQRTQPAGRDNPVTCTGHADFVQLQDGSWWSVFLGCRAYSGEYYNTGRETFLLPMTWTQDDWPMILPESQLVPLTLQAPRLGKDAAKAGSTPGSFPLTGNFSLKDPFNGAELAPWWLSLRFPASQFSRLEQGQLILSALPGTLASKDKTAFLARRLQHQHCTAETELVMPLEQGLAAGLVAFQGENFHYFQGLRRASDSTLEVFVECCRDGKIQVLARAIIPQPADGRLRLRFVQKVSTCSFEFSPDGEHWSVLLGSADAKLLSTNVAGGFVGAMLGLHARLESKP